MDRRPAVLIVGRVVALREHLRWFDARPLFGKRVLVTRPREQAAELVDRLEAMGAEAIEAPMIQIVPPDDYGPLDDACARVATFDWIIFSSAVAVDAFIERLLKTMRASQSRGEVSIKLSVGSHVMLTKLRRRIDHTPPISFPNFNIVKIDLNSLQVFVEKPYRPTMRHKLKH